MSEDYRQPTPTQAAIAHIERAATWLEEGNLDHAKDAEHAARLRSVAGWLDSLDRIETGTALLGEALNAVNKDTERALARWAQVEAARRHERRVDGGQPGTLEVCPVCDGTGVLHRPDTPPERSTPTDWTEPPPFPLVVNVADLVTRQDLAAALDRAAAIAVADHERDRAALAEEAGKRADLEGVVAKLHDAIRGVDQRLDRVNRATNHALSRTDQALGRLDVLERRPETPCAETLEEVRSDLDARLRAIEERPRTAWRPRIEHIEARLAVVQALAESASADLGYLVERTVTGEVVAIWRAETGDGGQTTRAALLDLRRTVLDWSTTPLARHEHTEKADAGEVAELRRRLDSHTERIPPAAHLDAEHPIPTVRLADPCGAVAPDRSRWCMDPAGHDGRHDWDPQRVVLMMDSNAAPPRRRRWRDR